MRKITTLLLLTALCGAVALAQPTGKLIYEQKVNVHANLTPEQEVYKSMIPEFVTTGYSLSFKGGKARLQKVEAPAGGGTQVQVMTMGGGTDVLFDAALGKVYRLAVLDAGKFYVESAMEATQGTAMPGEREILGFACKLMEVAGDDDGEVYRVWYTTEAGIKGSPMPGIYLDGLVLAIEGKTITYLATAMEQGAVDAALLAVPEGYRKVLPEQLADLEEEAREELMRNGGVRRTGGN